jgi:enterochelin esterase-like enzyme
MMAGAALTVVAGAWCAVQLRAGEAAAAATERLQLGVMLQGDGACPGAAPGSETAGACVMGVAPESAAYRTGLRAGDQVLQLGEVAILQPGSLPAAMQAMRVGDAVEVTYLRNGEKQHATVKFEARDRAGARPLASAMPMPADACDATLASGTSLPQGPYRKLPLALDRRAVETLLGGNSAAVASQGDVLTFAFRAEGGSARVLGTIQCALDRVEDSSLWALQLRMAQWPQTFLSAQFLATTGSSPAFAASGSLTHEELAKYRGSAAPREPASAQPLRGRLIEATVPSRFLQTSKQVTVYLPPGKTAAPLPVLYMTDGQSTRDFAPIVEALIAAHRIRPLAIVGEHARLSVSDPSKPYDPREDQRAQEYLPGVDSAQFDRHMRFFVEELLPWAEKQYGLSAARADRAAMGFSNGGGFVARLGLQHPEGFSAVMPFSPAGAPFGRADNATDPVQMPRFLLAGGELESIFLANARAQAAWLNGRGIASDLRSYWSGHDIVQWQQALADYLPEVFPAKGK